MCDILAEADPTSRVYALDGWRTASEYRTDYPCNVGSVVSQARRALDLSTE